MPTTIDAYSAYEDLVFYGEKYRVTVSLGLVSVRLGNEDCAWGRLTENDGVAWTDVFSHPGVTGAATRVVQEMLRWSREQRARESHKHKYGYYPGEHVQ